MKQTVEVLSQKLFELLTDATNFEWAETDSKLVYEWVEGDHSLEVKATSSGSTEVERVLFWHTKTERPIFADANDPDALLVATHYAQFSEWEGEYIGSQEQFEAYVAAYKVLGGEPDFVGQEKRIIATFGEPFVYLEWKGKSYELWNNGIVAHAATPNGLLAAQQKIVKMTNLYEKSMKG